MVGLVRKLWVSGGSERPTAVCPPPDARGVFFVTEYVTAGNELLPLLVSWPASNVSQVALEAVLDDEHGIDGVFHDHLFGSRFEGGDRSHLRQLVSGRTRLGGEAMIEGDDIKMLVKG